MNHFKLSAVALLGVAQLVIFNVQAAPAITSFTDPAVFYGEENSVGYSFIPTNNIAVDSLGFYDSDHDGLIAHHTVAIYDVSQTVLGIVGVNNDSVLNGDFRYSNLSAPLNLEAGKTYFIVGTTAGGDGWVYQADNIITNGITYTGSYFHNGFASGAVFPETYALDREYMTVNFNVAAVPEPETYAMLLVGLGLLGFMARHRKERKWDQVANQEK